MNKLRVVVLISGEGTTMKAINEAMLINVLNIDLVSVVSNSNKFNNKLLTDYCEENKINLEYIEPTIVSDRDEMENKLIFHLNNLYPDLVVLAGWNRIISKKFIQSFKNIINIHPALPNTFIGQNCIRKAYEAYQRGEIKNTGSMVHKVIEMVDAGEVISQVDVDIYPDDTYQDLEDRVKSYEKGIMIEAIQKYVCQHNKEQINSKKPYIGKVRKVTDIGYDLLMMTASNRLSAFDKHMCQLNNKGNILNYISKWWFQNTENIIENHYIYSNSNHMIVKKTQPIKLEFIVRGYMTGSTNTSIWPMYNRGERDMYGIKFRDGYQKNQKLDEIILTPTTKGVSDSPITEKEIVEQEYLTQTEFDFVKNKSLELFKFGQIEAEKRGLLLVDTKYEFGFYNGSIILIDEIHTCDSSRYWKLETYQERLNQGLEPEKYDKDCVRDWVKKNCDPYTEEIPTIPNKVISKVENVYLDYYKLFDGNELDLVNMEETLFLENYLDYHHQNKVIIISGSQSDMNHNLKIQNELKKKGIYSKIHVSSAHKNTKQVLELLENYNNFSGKLIYVTVAGMSNALSGVVSCNTQFPVFACPPHSDKDDMMVNIQSTLQCPSNVPAMTILRPDNIALAIQKIFNL
jgi:phosphoribosylaminoimidazole-succinocarboxamide synthase/formyltetrahydrofolate-dependent phosphoribosylglycinamide formyltransferase